MNKQGINPITVHSRSGYPQAAVTIGRLAFGVGAGPLMKTVQVVVYDPAKQGEKDIQGTPIAILDEEQFIDALGHLFPHGELKEAHTTGLDLVEQLKKMLIPPKVGQPVAPAESGQVDFAPFAASVELRPTQLGYFADDWLPMPEQWSKISALQHCYVAYPLAAPFRVQVSAQSLSELLEILPGVIQQLREICSSKPSQA